MGGEECDDPDCGRAARAERETTPQPAATTAQYVIAAATEHDGTVEGIRRVLVEHASTAAEAIRAINHATQTGPIPAPVLYELLGELKLAAQRLPQALTQLADRLDASLRAYDVYDEPGRDPHYSVIEANTHLSDTARYAEKLAERLEAAQTAIHAQGYRTPDGETE